VLLFSIGQTFIVTSTWALGVTGTFLGNYFGILMDHRVEGCVVHCSTCFVADLLPCSFPFNVLHDPMYVGSTMCFARTALWYARFALLFSGFILTLYRYERPAGLFITPYVYIVYIVALRFEGYVDTVNSRINADGRRPLIYSRRGAAKRKT
jgi:methylene-fatty-acyl-phospholipid synthase